MRTFVIAEAGSNHNGSLEQAYRLIDAACDAKAQAVKFQTYSSETLYCKSTPDFGGHTNVSELIKGIEIDRSWQKQLKEYCDAREIEFMSTPFDERAIDELCELGVKRLKVAGFESSDARLLRLVAKTQLPLIVSAGIGSTLDSIRQTIREIKTENSDCDITILHCNNAYPTPISDINLTQILAIKEEFGIKVGLSDHTEGIFVPPLAVALGATCIEKHFTLSRRLPGPDHSFAIEPEELSQMVKNIESAEICMSLKEGGITASELKFQQAMRSVVTKRKILKGEVLNEGNATTKRPFLKNSIPAKEFFNVMGRELQCDVEEDEPITWEDLRENV